MPEKLLVTVPEAAAMASVGRSTAYGLVASGEWPSVTIGRTRKIPIAALRKWVRDRTHTVEDRSNRSCGADEQAP